MAGRAAFLILCCLYCLGCESASKDFRHQFFAFGTLVTIDFFDAPARSNATAISAIQTRTKDIDNNWYPLADAAATAPLVGGAEEFEEICRVLGIGEALIVTKSGDLRLTRAMEKRLNWPDRQICVRRRQYVD